MIRLFSALCVGAMLTFTGCAGRIYDTSYDYDREADFSSLRTYDWVPMVKEKGKAARLDELTTKRIQEAVDHQLDARGYVLERENPGLLVETVYGATTTRRRAPMSGKGYRYDVGWLSLDFIDAGRDSLVWHGSAKIELDAETTPEKSEAAIRDVVAEILSNFPPKK